MLCVLPYGPCGKLQKNQIVVTSMQAWEGRAYDYGMANLKGMGFPVDDLEFDPDLVLYCSIGYSIIHNISRHMHNP